MRDVTRDIVDGLGYWRLWGSLAWFDILGRYRRSMIGPWWITISIALFVSALSVIYAQVLNVSLSLYVPHLSVGYVMWLLLSSVVVESTTAFAAAQAIILQRRLPYLVYIARVVSRNCYVLLHNILIYIPVALIFAIYPTAATLYVIPGMVLVYVNLLWIGLLVAIVGTRFRDVAPLISNIVQLAFFATPVLWMPDRLVSHAAIIVDVNLLYHLIEIVRAPLLGHAPSTFSFGYAVVAAFIGWAITLVVFHKSRSRIVYWL